jgi:hypothetical protein
VPSPVWCSPQHARDRRRPSLAAALPRLDALAASRLRLDGWTGRGWRNAAPWSATPRSAPFPAILEQPALTLAEASTCSARARWCRAPTAGRSSKDAAVALRNLQMLRRVGVLPTASRQLLTLAAVIGERFDSQLLQIANHDIRSSRQAGNPHALVHPAGAALVAQPQARPGVWSGGARSDFSSRSARCAMLYHQIDTARRRSSIAAWHGAQNHPTVRRSSARSPTASSPATGRARVPQDGGRRRGGPATATSPRTTRGCGRQSRPPGRQRGRRADPLKRKWDRGWRSHRARRGGGRGGQGGALFSGPLPASAAPPCRGGASPTQT